MEELMELRKLYLKKFGEEFPEYVERWMTQEQMICTIKECLTKGKIYDEGSIETHY